MENKEFNVKTPLALKIFHSMKELQTKNGLNPIATEKAIEEIENLIIENIELKEKLGYNHNVAQDKPKTSNAFK